MKKLLAFVVLPALAIFFFNCHSAKKSASKDMAGAPAVTYASQVQSVVATNCAPCHFPDKGGRVKALDTYDALKLSIDDAVRRIELNPDEKGFMPFKHPKLSDSTIAVFKQWRDAGSPQ